MNDVLQYFLLRSTRIGGKEALKPLLPYVASTGAIYTGAVSWAFNFTEEHIVPGSFQITYTPLADRKPFCAVVLWRQHPTDDIGIVRSTEVRYTGTAVDGPFEQHDISEYCASENHAVKVGAYILSRRNHITHTLSITVKPDSFNPTLTAGDLVRVRLERTPSTGASSLHNYLYEVDRIGKNLSGDVLLDLTEFPVDDQLRSVVALEVNSAIGNGVLMPTGITGITCDINSLIDTSVPTEVGSNVPGFDGAYDFDLGGFDGSGLGDFGTGNAGDGLDGQGAGGGGVSGGTITGGTGPSGAAQVGDELTYDPGCEGAFIEWRLVDDETGEYSIVSSGVAVKYLVASEAAAAGKSIVGVGKCPDPSAPDGYGPEITSEPFKVSCLASIPTITVTGTYSPTGVTTWDNTGLIANCVFTFACTPFTRPAVVNPNPAALGIKGPITFGGSPLRSGVPGPACSSRANITLSATNAANNPIEFASATVGFDQGCLYWSGTLVFSSTAPDARDASELNC
jgi:hypothetical protein